MKCPSCGSADYYSGILVMHDCANRSCRYYNNGSAGGGSVETKQEPGDSLDFQGFCVIQEDWRDTSKPVGEHYVFATRADAKRWHDMNGYVDREIQEVRSFKPFRWQPSRGAVRGVILADRLYELLRQGEGEPNTQQAVIHFD